jgi:hypothetical protein
LNEFPNYTKPDTARSRHSPQGDRESRERELNVTFTDAEKFVFASIASTLEKSLPVGDPEFPALLKNAEEIILRHTNHPTLAACRESYLGEINSPTTTETEKPDS